MTFLLVIVVDTYNVNDFFVRYDNLLSIINIVSHKVEFMMMIIRLN